MDAATMVLYTGLLMAVAVGMTAWRLVAADVKVGSQVDRLLAGCLVTSGVLFVSALLPGNQLP
ncbi:hypothetical protein [Nocardioides antri]|uniref:Uncharacterized protein n=1 Tax=Nocardioides antri TaxID=2607659 RepID=A0A5B1M505_9ACTN|nr:hypothetical protein [Nocardioides antri]KAA1427538.1 hypothetical protein F0U47_08745 [Nocardioides antri]